MGAKLLKLGYKIVPEQFKEMNKRRLLKCRLIGVVFIVLYLMIEGSWLKIRRTEQNPVL